MTDDEITRLRTLAQAATPGPWKVHPWSATAVYQPEYEVWLPAGPDDAAYIAAANPDVVLALLAERDALLLDRQQRALRGLAEADRALGLSYEDQMQRTQSAPTQGDSRDLPVKPASQEHGHLAGDKPAPGWKLVPVEPTEEMLAAAHEGDREYTLRCFGDVMTIQQSPHDHWVAMVAASPPAPSAEPVATLHNDGYFSWESDAARRKYDSQWAGWRMAVYAAPPAPGTEPDEAEKARCASICDDEARLRTEAGYKHPEGSPERGRCFAAARAALNCARGIRDGEPAPISEPVAWMYTSHHSDEQRYITRYQHDLSTYKADKVWPLYTAPPAPSAEPVAFVCEPPLTLSISGGAIVRWAALAAPLPPGITSITKHRIAG